MDRTERFYKIEMLIRSRGSVSFAALMDELGVSRATLKRDLEYLRERLDAPIVYDRFDNGYKLQADPRDARQVKHQLPGVWFSEREYVVNALGYIVQHLVVLLDPAQLIDGLQDVYRRDDFRDARYAALVTGPSATADIEGVLIRGAQGVRSLTVVWVAAQ